MIGSNLEKQFRKIGAKHEVVFLPRNRMPTPFRLDIVNDKTGDEFFQILVRADVVDDVDLSVLEVKPSERHLVLMAKVFDDRGNVSSKVHFLCGHDERHLFVASVSGVSTVIAAKESLRPDVIKQQETGMSSKKRNKRRNKVYIRQGEWFFIPSSFSPPDPKMIRQFEPLVRSGGGKPHIAQFAYRLGGEPVLVCAEYPIGVSHAEYRKIISVTPAAKRFNWRDMLREAKVYVRGSVRHPDHATIVLEGWHEVLMNTERRTAAVAFLD